MKERLLKLLQAKEERKKELGQKANATEDIKELRAINTELEGLNGEIAELRGMIDAIPDETPSATPPGGGTQPTEQRGASPIGTTQILGSYAIGTGTTPPAEHRTAETDDPYGTIEYRQAFRTFATTGQITQELRANAMTTTGDVSAVIPSTILNEVIRKVTVYGQVFSRVRKLSVRGGVTIPILSLKPVATWIGETPTSDKQKVQANSNISFSYYGLECKVSTSLLADTVTLTGFENTITDLIVEAMVKALDLSIVKGNGTGKCLGISADTRIPASQIVALTAAEFKSWEAWKKKVFAKMPLSYKAGATFLMASGTFEGYIDGMVDTTGQPIGRINYGITDGPQERFGGKEVVLVEDDIIAPYDDAASSEVVTIYCNLRNYGVNSNMQMTMFRYFDHDTNEWVDKAILIVDGKLIDPYGVVIVKKGAAT